MEYKELGVDYIDKKKKDKILSYYLRKLNDFGYKVNLEKAA